MASDALNSANNAKASETGAQQAASSAQTFEQNAQASANQAEDSETTAASSASTATQQAGIAKNEADRAKSLADLIPTDILRSSQNLSDLMNIEISRSNLDVYNKKESSRLTSLSDFVNGTLVTTSLPILKNASLSFRIDVKGKSYGSGTPTYFLAEAYWYNNSFIARSGVKIGGPVKQISVFEYNEYLSFWWARTGYWNSYSVWVSNTMSTQIDRNYIVEIKDSVKPEVTHYLIDLLAPG